MCLCNICVLQIVTASKTSAVVSVCLSAISTGLSWIVGVNPLYINICTSLLFVLLSSATVIPFLAVQKRQRVYVLPIIIAQVLFFFMLLGLYISTAIKEWSELSTLDNIFYIVSYLCVLYVNFDLLCSHIRCYRLLLTTNRDQQECTIRVAP